MNRYTPRNSTEFESRQQAFDFGAACRFVAALAADVKKALQGFVKGFFRKNAPAVRGPHQLVLELDSIAQIPLFQLRTV